MLYDYEKKRYAICITPSSILQESAGSLSSTQTVGVLVPRPATVTPTPVSQSVFRAVLVPLKLQYFTEESASPGISVRPMKCLTLMVLKRANQVQSLVTMLKMLIV